MQKVLERVPSEPPTLRNLGAEEMSSQTYDCIVIGAGIQGSFTAYHLAKNNRRTLLIEQVSDLVPRETGCRHNRPRAAHPDSNRAQRGE